MRALILFTLQRKLHTNMGKMQLLGYWPQPACSGRPACDISSIILVYIRAVIETDHIDESARNPCQLSIFWTDQDIDLYVNYIG